MKRLLSFLTIIVLISTLANAQSKESIDKLNKARREMESPQGNPVKIEKLLKESIKASPDYIDAHHELANFYSIMRRFEDAANEFKTTKTLDDTQHKLSRGDRDAVLDGLGVSLAQARHMDDALAVYKSALAENPNYALFEYNLACVYAEKGDLDSAIPHLKKSWEIRDTLPRGQQFPDPRKDDSFRRFWNDPRFQRAVENMVL